MDQQLKEQILLRMQYDNPWWTTNNIPEDLQKLPHRLYLSLFYPLVKQKEIRRGVILMGPRRVGKTIMLYHTISHLIADKVNPQRIIYLSVDTPIYNNLSLEEMLSMACEAVGQETISDDYYVFYDEVQYLKEWELHLKSLIDSYRNVKFVASGSACAALKMKSIESGAGRFTDFILPPLTFHEYLHMQKIDNIIVPKRLNWEGQVIEGFDAINMQSLNEHFLDYINFGGYPEIVFSESMRKDPNQYIQHDIVDKVLLRDLPSLYGINNTQELYRLFIHIVFFTGQEFSYEDLSRHSGIRKETIKKYVEYLEAAFLIKVIHRIDANARRMQRVTSFKIYLTNPSLRCALFSPLSMADEMLGSMVETAIFAQWLQRDYANIYYANWKDGRKLGEVDMVGIDIAHQKPNWCVEIKWSDRYVNKVFELKSLLSFLEKNKLSSSIVTSISAYTKKEQEGKRLYFMPSALYAYQIGYNTIKQKVMNVGM